ncbi:MAG: HD domain-containing phosphohydrolase [candidate division FCPU426 bacterium]
MAIRSRSKQKKRAVSAVGLKTKARRRVRPATPRPPLSRYQHQMEIMRKIALHLSSEKSLEQMLDTLVKMAAEFFTADAVSCMLWDDEKQNIVIRAGNGFLTHYIQQQSIPGDRIRALTAGGADHLYFENLQKTPQGDLRLIRDEHLVSVLTVVLRFGDEVLGGINIYSRGKVRRFSQEEIENARIFAHEAAVAVRNASLYQRMREEAQFAQTLLQVAEEVGSLNSLDEVVNRLIIILSRSVSFRQCSIFTWDEKRNLFLPRRASGIPPGRNQHFYSLVLRAEEVPFLPRELSRREVIRVEEAPGRFPVEKLAEVLSERDLRLVPLVTKNKLLGVIIVAGYKGKPGLRVKDEQLLRGIAAEAAIAIDDANLFSALEDSFWDIIKSLAAAIEVKDSYTHSHSESVINYALALAEALELSPKDLDLLNKACMLHDLGKIGIDDSILQKVTPLTFEERKNIERHPVIGSQILRSVRSLWEVADIVRYHHERYDGSGYPDRLKGEEIPLLARVLALADSFDAMTSDRPYRQALTLEQAVNQLKGGAATQFDPVLVEVFLRLLDAKRTTWGLTPPRTPSSAN